MARALAAYAGGDEGATLTVHTDEGDTDSMPVSLFFRSREDLRDVDREALALARGRVLDVGAGVGSLSLVLQDRGLSVTAIEVIPEAVEIMTRRGVRDARLGRVQELGSSQDFDTVLMLMNGTALAGTRAGLLPLLRTVEELLASGGQILMDSTDLTEGGGNEEGDGTEDENGSQGELHYQLEFQGERGAPFPQLFLDPLTLETMVLEGGWRMELVWQGDSGEYLSRLTRGENDSG